jgi:hypothetical protein
LTHSVISGKKSIMAASYQNNSVIQWLKQKNCWVPKDGTQAAVTHYLLNPYGKASIPEAKFKEFLEVYAEYNSMTKKPSLGIVEKHGSVFYMFFDLDVKVSCDDELESVRGKVPELLLTIYTAVGATSEMVVCTCEPYKPNMSLEERKCGLHLHWPGLQVDTALAMSHRQACMEACEKTFGPELAAGRSWAEVFDHRVLQPQGGLRMIASTKEAKSLATVYLPKYVVKDGMLEEVQNPYLGFYSWLVKTRISVPPCVSSSPGRSLGQHSTTGSHASPGAPASMSKDLEQAIRSCITEQDFKEVPFTTLLVHYPKPKPGKRRKKGNLMELPTLSVGLRTKRCMNLVGRPCHSNNHTYITVCAEGLFQKCHSDNPTCEGRRFKSCASFRGRIGYTNEHLKSLMLAMCSKAGE